MDVDKLTEEDKKKKKKKGKGKEKQTADDKEEEKEMELVGGTARCCACVRDGEQCHINMQAILRWRTSVEAGKVTARAPTGTSCQRCNTSLHRPCDLPGTADLWAKVNKRRGSRRKSRGGSKEEGDGR